MAQLFDECGGLAKLEELQNHENGDVYQKAVKMLDAFFGVEEDDAALTPAVTAEGFAFGLGAAGGATAEAMHFTGP